MDDHAYNDDFISCNGAGMLVCFFCEHHLSGVHSIPDKALTDGAILADESALPAIA